jgi:adenosine deaminase
MVGGPSAVRDLRTLPKAHVHVHLEGAMRPTTMAQLAVRNRMAAPSPLPDRAFGSFAEFLTMYRRARELIRSFDDLQQLVREVVEDAADDGAVWIEPSFRPTNYRFLSPEKEVVAAVLEAGRSAARECRIGFGLMISASRTASSEDAEKLARLAVSFADRGVVSFGLENARSGYPDEAYADAFGLARSARLMATPHAGELDGYQSVLTALDYLGADRVQHGIRAVERSELLRRIADEGTCLDVCPTSNVLLGIVPTLQAHPLPALLAAGVRCSVNADDPLLFGVGILDEYQACRVVLGLDDRQLAGVARTSIEASGAPGDKRRAALARLSDWVECSPV